MALNRSFAGAAARTTLNGAITAGSPTDAQTFTLTSGSGYPTANFVIAVFTQAADGTRTGEEKILVVSRTGNVCTVGTAGRGFDSTTAADHANGSLVEHCIDAAWFTAAGAQIDLVSDVPTDRLLGRDTAGTGNPERLTVGGGLEFTGSGGVQIAGSGVSTAKIADAAATLAKLADLANATVIGRNTAGTGVPEAVTMTQLAVLLAAVSSPPSSVVAESHADVAVGASSTAEATLTTLTLPGGRVAAGDLVRMIVWVDYALGGGGTITWRFKIGATTVLTYVGTPPNSNRHNVKLEFDIMCVSATAQRVMWAALNTSTGSPAALILTSATSVGYGTAAENTATGKAIVVTVQLSTNNAGNDVTAHAATLELVKKV